MGLTLRTAGRWFLSASALRTFSVAGVVANVVIVLTGGAVRLTASGLGCPTWPRCTSGSLVRTAATGGHGLIEFTNRTLTFALALVALGTVLAAMGQHRERRLALLALAGIPAQAVLGGISVLTHLNPWIVGAHLLLSMAILAVTVRLAWRVYTGRRPASRAPAGAAAILLSRLLVALTAAVLLLGTVVTGAGPHAGAADTDGRVHRNGLSPAAVSQLHADAVLLLIGLSVGMVLLLIATGADRRRRNAAQWLLGVELGQAVIGYVQYFTHVPAQLVELHLFGACLVWVAALVLLAQLTWSENLRDGVDHEADERTDQRAVHPDELQVAPDLDLQPAAGLRGVPTRNRG